MTYSKRDSTKTASRHPLGRIFDASFSASDGSGGSFSDHAFDQTIFQRSKRRGDTGNPLRSDNTNEKQGPGFARVQFWRQVGQHETHGENDKPRHLGHNAEHLDKYFENVLQGIRERGRQKADLSRAFNQPRHLTQRRLSPELVRQANSE